MSIEPATFPEQANPNPNQALEPAPAIEQPSLSISDQMASEIESVPTAATTQASAPLDGTDSLQPAPATETTTTEATPETTAPNLVDLSKIPAQPTSEGGIKHTLNNLLSNKKLAIAILSIIGLVIVVTIGLLVINALKVSKDDYTESYNYVNDTVRVSNNKLGARLISIEYSYSGSSSLFASDISEARSIIDTIKSNNQALSSQKAVKSGEAKQKFEAYNNATEEFLNSAKEYIDTAENTYPAISNCYGSGLSGSMYTANEALPLISDCLAKLEGLSDIKNKEISTLVDSLTKSFTQLKQIASNINDMDDPYSQANYDERNSLIRKSYDVEAEIYKTIDSYKEGVSQNVIGKKPTKQLDDLSNHLLSKSSNG